MGSEKIGSERLLYFDILRIVSVFFMMLIHASSYCGLYEIPIISMQWQFLNSYDSIARFCVPAFVMISGVFFLDDRRSYPIKKLYKHNILRILTATLFWSTIYAVFMTLLNYQIFNLNVLYQTVITIILGHYHLWFLYTLIGLYLIVPFLRKICEDKRLEQYFLILSFIFTFGVNILKTVPKLQEIIEQLESKTNLYFILGYTGYFLLGHYLVKYGINKKTEIAVYILGILAVPVTVVATYIKSLQDGAINQDMYAYLLPTTALTATAVFLFFKNKVSKIKVSKKAEKVILLFSKVSFGMYLVHDFVIIFLFKTFNLTPQAVNFIAAAPVITLVVFAISFVIVFVINKIPVLNRYIM